MTQCRYPILQVADGQPVQFQLTPAVIQLNTPYGQLAYSASLQGGQQLPAWLAVTPDGLISGTPQLVVDAMIDVTITGTDADGAQNSTGLQLAVKAPCPAGQYRHFRVRIGQTNEPRWYDPWNYNAYGGTSSDLCTVQWQSSQASAAAFPSPASQPAGVNISGTSDAGLAFQQYGWRSWRGCNGAFWQVSPQADGVMEGCLIDRLALPHAQLRQTLNANASSQRPKASYTMML